ncbi:ASCH domain-containing protein [Streptomyces xiamenensis]|uniref:ASCH domain-containing protein n=1 Tax=Streptomyces xiamenensis TaxID=408015 RepID=UPI0035D9C75D
MTTGEGLRAPYPGGTTMRALTIRQPWADAIAHGPKRTENRSWTTVYRGVLLIHAAAKPDTGDVTAARYQGKKPDARGAIIAAAELTDVHRPEGPYGCPCSTRWAEPDTYHWVLDKVIPLFEPIAAKGQLGLWHPAQDLLATVQADLTSTRPREGNCGHCQQPRPLFAASPDWLAPDLLCSPCWSRYAKARATGRFVDEDDAIANARTEGRAAANLRTILS